MKMKAHKEKAAKAKEALTKKAKAAEKTMKAYSKRR